ncbi:MAG: hypothetical protein EBY15_02840 [Gammaproteobacteria bacterium]|nr:hypothetical protein [Gammaproteobacteria bacterium]
MGCVLMALVVGLLACRGVISFLQPFSPDECMHLHNVWMVGKHLLPYVDYFDHHACAYHFTMAPFSSLFQPELNQWNAVAFLSFARGVSGLAGIFSVVLLVKCGHAWNGIRCGLFAAAFLLGNTFFLRSSIETRPDVLAMPFWLTGFGLLASHLRLPQVDVSVAPENRPLNALRWMPFAVSGVLFGLGIVFTQKILFLLPGVIVTLVLWAMASASPQPSRVQLVHPCATFLAGAALPAVVLWAYFCLQGAGTQFIDKVLLINARWTYHASPATLIQLFLRENLGFTVVTGLAIIAGLRTMTVKRELDWIFVLALLMAGGWSVGLCVVIPVSGQQFYLASLPLAALLAGKFMAELLAWGRNWLVVMSIWLVAISASVSTLPRYFHNLRARDSSNFAATIWMMENTNPTDTVLDGWTGIGVFRPQAWYYGYLHHEIPLMISEVEVRKFYDDVMAFRVKPTVIVDDGMIFALEPLFFQWVQTNYVHVPEARAYLRRDRYNSQASRLGQTESQTSLPSPSKQTEVRDK